jgi:hypothetical protein
MQFGVTDHVDASGIPPAEQLEQRLRLVELYERLGFSRYMLTEHHGTPLNLVPSPHLFLAAASQRTRRIRLGTLVTALPLDNPVLMALQVLDVRDGSGGYIREFEIGVRDPDKGARLRGALARGPLPFDDGRDDGGAAGSEAAAAAVVRRRLG